MFIVFGFVGGWMAWLVLRACIEGRVTARSLTFERTKEPFWFWLALSFYALGSLAGASLTVASLSRGLVPGAG
jgi:hypothetical protein